VWLNHDLDISVKPSQEFHEAIDRVFPKIASEHARDLGLTDSHALSGLRLGQLALPRQAVDFRDDLRLEQVGLGVGQAEIGKDVVTSGFDLNFPRHGVLLLKAVVDSRAPRCGYVA
jgi:hypothetical protein